MQILQIHTSYRQPGGEDIVVEREAGLLRDAGHVVRQHMFSNPEGNIKASGALAGAIWNPRSYTAVRRLGLDYQPDVAHVHNTWFSLSPSIVTGLRRASIPVVVTLHNYRLLCVNGLLYRSEAPCTLCVGRSPLPGIRHRCYRASVPLSTLSAANITFNRSVGTWDDVDLFVALTEFGRQLFVTAGIPADRIAVKPHFAPDPGDRLTPPSASKTILYIGRISEEKGLGTLLRAWEAAALDGLELVVIGEGPLREKLEHEHVRSVRFLGRVGIRETANWMLRARALVFPSQWFETFGLVLVEALAAGTPVLASDLGGNSEVLSDLGSDWLVAATDVVAWSDALERLRHGAIVDTAGAVARTSFLNRYTSQIGLTNLEQVYQRAWQRNP